MTAARRWRPAPLLSGSAAFHAAGACVLAAAPRAWPWVTGALVANHALVACAGLVPRCGWLGRTWTRLPDDAAARGELALTFDDGPDPDVTPRVLDILARHGARATFFCVGRRVSASPALAREIAERGHVLENHTFRHRHHFFFHGPLRLSDEIARTQDVIESATGRRPRYFRAPAGIRSPLLDPALSRAGLELVAWTRRGFDTVRRDPAAVASALATALAPGDLLLLHDGSSARDGSGRPVVLEALDRVLDAAGARRLRVVPFSTGGAA